MHPEGFEETIEKSVRTARVSDNNETLGLPNTI
jgi:hypothetical protein